MAEQNPKLKVAVVGGGIVGLSFAVYLAQLGICELQLFEAALAFGAIGGGIEVGHNAMKVYTEMGLVNEIYEFARDLAGGPSDIWMDFMFGDGRNGGFNPICTITGPADTSRVHRADLVNLLVSRLPKESVYFGKHLSSYEQTPGGGVKLRFKDGSTAEADVLVSADGIKSTTRRIMYGDKADSVEPKWSGAIVYRGLVTMEKVVSNCGEYTAQRPTMWMGQNRHIIQYPVSQGQTVNIGAFVCDFTGERYPEWKGDTWIEQCQDPSEMLEDFRDWIDPVRDLLKNIERPQKWAVFELPHLPFFADGNVALIGDAAHASTPHQGNGASQGIEDVHVLGTLLSHPLTTASTVPLALRAYDAVRRPRAQRMQDTSYEAGQVYACASPVGEDEEQLARVLASRMAWIWDVDVGAQVGQAVSMLEESVECGRA